MLIRFVILELKFSVLFSVKDPKNPVQLLKCKFTTVSQMVMDFNSSVELVI